MNTVGIQCNIEPTYNGESASESDVASETDDVNMDDLYEPDEEDVSDSDDS